ncbi:hypothetical protein I7I48_05136 [Histoplasma ohiense]|nr:hypothetical protein I7I48_05136 [Histoplasma ohiense (nom. inval.)]
MENMPTIHSIHLMAENYTVLDGESLARIDKCVDRIHPACPPNQTSPLLRFAAVYLRLRGHKSKKPMCKFLDVLETEFELALRMQNAHVVNSLQCLYACPSCFPAGGLIGREKKGLNFDRIIG